MLSDCYRTKDVQDSEDVYKILIIRFLVCLIAVHGVLKAA